MKFSDETLQAYLEGRLDEAEMRGIEDAVTDDPALESRLMALDPIAPVVRDAFGGVPAQTPEIELPEPVSERPYAGPLRLLAVAASVTVLAVSATFWATRPAELGWIAKAAIYQSLYAPETVANINTSPDVLDAQIASAEAQLGRSLNRDVLESLPDLDLKRAQVLSFKGKPLVQLIFADAEGQPFAFCVIRHGEGAADKGVSLAVLSGLATANWTLDGYGYMLLGSDPQTDLDGKLDILTGAFTG